MTETAVERLHLDVVPAEVFAPGASLHVQQNARVFITDRRVQVWVRGPDGPVLLVDEPYTSDPPRRNRGTLQGQVHLETAKGTVNVTRGRGCGCGGGMRTIDPPAKW